MKSHTEYLIFETKKRREMVHITDQVELELAELAALRACSRC